MTNIITNRFFSTQVKRRIKIRLNKINREEMQFVPKSVSLSSLSSHYPESKLQVPFLLSMDAAQLDDLIRRLLNVKNGRPGKIVQLTEQEIRHLCTAVRPIFINQPNLLELEAPIKICGLPTAILLFLLISLSSWIYYRFQSSLFDPSLIGTGCDSLDC